MHETWRLLDTGLASVARNVALTRALLEARHAEESPSTLRFLRYSSGALIGCNRSVRNELNVAYCTANGIPVQRRITNGTAWFVDERQLGWELCVHRREIGTATLSSIMKRVCHAAATALSALGLDARYRARDEIEVGGRTLCAAAAAAEGGGVLVQGVLMIEPDFERLVGALRLPLATSAADEPAARLGHDIAAARWRMAGLKELLGRLPEPGLVRRNLAEAFESVFDVEFREGELSLTEHARYQRALAEVDTPGWTDVVSTRSNMPLLGAEQRVGGALLRATLKYDPERRTVAQIWFSGDLSLNPRRSLNDLETALRDVPVNQAARQIESFFASRAVDTGVLRPSDFVSVVRIALGEPLVT